MRFNKVHYSKVSRRITSLFSVLLMLFYIIVSSAAITFAGSAPKVFDVINITDFHGSLLDAYNNQVGAVLAEKIEETVNANPDRSIVIGGGDLYQGSALSNILRGEPVMKMLNSIGMEATAVGNHEFDWGINKVTTSTPNYTYICANIYDKTTGKRVFAPYKMITKDGVKIAVVGGITEEAPTVISAKFINGYEFKDLAAEVNEAAKEAKDSGAQIIIADLHAGDNYDSKTGEIFAVANKLQGVDAVMGGHTHDEITAALANGTPVTIASSNGKGFTDLRITLNGDGTKSLNTNFVSIYKDKSTLVDVSVDKAVYKSVYDKVFKIVTDAQAQVGPILNQKLGTAQIDLTRTQNVKPFGESLAGNWCTDVITKAAKADFGFQNNGGLRCDIPKGQLTMSTIYQFMPFNNEIVTLKMTAPQIKMVLENAVGEDPSNKQGSKGVQVSGLKFTYDPQKPFGQKVIKIVKNDGTVINLNDNTTKYTVATNDFMTGGKDGFTEFLDAALAPTLQHTGILIRDALAQNVKDSGQITANYESRITIAPGQRKIDSENTTNTTNAGLIAGRITSE